MDVRQRVKVKVAEAGVPLAVIARSKGLDYQRVQRVLGGYAQPRPGEVEALLRAIELCAIHAQEQARSPLRKA